MVVNYDVDGHFLREFIRAVEQEYNEVSHRQYILKSSNNINYAQGTDLDLVAALLDIERYSQENDSDFRARVMSYVNSFDACGTKSAFISAFKERFGYDVTTEDVTPIPTVKVWIDAQSIIDADMSLVDEDLINQLIEVTKAAGVNYTFAFMIYVNNNSNVEGITVREQTSVTSGSIGSLIWDEGKYDETLWG